MASLPKFQFAICTAVASLVSSGALAASSGDCYTELDGYSNKCYYSMSTSAAVSHSGAAALCGERNGRLPLVASEALANAFGRMLWPAGVTTVWADGECELSGGSYEKHYWHYTDGRQITHSVWDEGQPTGGGRAECVVLTKNETSGYFVLHDVPCKRQVDEELVLCERGPTVDKATSPAAVDTSEAQTGANAERSTRITGDASTATTLTEDNAITTEDDIVQSSTMHNEQLTTEAESGIVETTESGIVRTSIQPPTNTVVTAETETESAITERIPDDTTTPQAPASTTLGNGGNGHEISMKLLIILSIVAAAFYTM